MENESGAIILAVVLAAGFFFLLCVKAAIFFRQFNDDTRYLKSEIRRAQDRAEYLYWLKELRCHYLCLIPFVNGKNVSGVYGTFFHKPRHAKEEGGKGIYRMLAPSLVGMGICAICLCGASWAWFSASVGSGVQTIKSANYQLETVVETQGEDGKTTVEKNENGAYTIFENTEYTVTLKATGTEKASGYCKVKIGDKEQFTEQIAAGGTFTFKVNLQTDEDMLLETCWGTSAADAVRIKESEEIN